MSAPPRGRASGVSADTKGILLCTGAGVRFSREQDAVIKSRTWNRQQIAEGHTKRRMGIYECILKTQLVPGLHPVSGRNVHCICLRLRRQRIPVGQMEHQNIRTVERIVQTYNGKYTARGNNLAASFFLLLDIKPRSP